MMTSLLALNALNAFMADVPDGVRAFPPPPQTERNFAMIKIALLLGLLVPLMVLSTIAEAKKDRLPPYAVGPKCDGPKGGPK